jgi:hypothetical protein
LENLPVGQISRRIASLSLRPAALLGSARFTKYSPSRVNDR